ncbi:matrix-remodeling-associated protein 5 [Sceloporus undulatus]|uniref:matrix-remodeling-associated protein 5 n=1 Tax=Sceloporus undulatus TaxID=8520 RepID=UPI001C4B555E|nr:matrix-remodeling-associated protein 5 [Sceloporus undulatus]
MKKSEKMSKQPNLGTLSVVLILSLGLPEVSLACPRPCACYVPTEVHCTFRSLTAVPTSISKHVERINLGFNSIQTISENSFAGLAKLELLMIHGNDIQNIPNGALKDLTSLQVFKISYNKLQGITGQTLQGLSSLMRLHMDHNRIEFIHPNAFNGLTSLRLLHLEGNLLQQLHPNTFSTFLVLDYFRLSTIKHLYLSENALRTLPVGIFQKMPLLENVYLHGNPWSCDCRLKWLLEWNEKSTGVLKCKKDKAYEEGQFCPKCSFPKQFQKQDIQNVKDISCTKPVLQSSLKQTISPKEEEQEDDISHLPMEEFQLSPWNITLNLTDEHGNLVNLNCEIKKPTDSTKIQWNQVSPHEIEVNTTISLDLECLMSRDNYEKLWKLIAYYSEVPVKLEREYVLSYEPKLSYHYKQGSDYDALYYTGVKGRIFAEPTWVMQPLIHIQLNRRQSTGKKVVLSFSTRVSQTFQTQENRQQRNSWVMIEHDEYTRDAQTLVEGSDTQLSCNVKASESPSITWMLPDGTKLKAPFKMEDSRYSVLSSGQLVIRSVAYADSGVYHCVAQVRNDVDTMSYRVQVHPPVIQPPDSETTKVEKNVGDSILLPCNAVAIPDAHLSWILPNSHILHDLSNSSNGYLLHNGTLLIPHSHVRDSGYYRCVAINQQGSDQFSVKVTVNKMISDRSSKRAKFKKHPGSRISIKAREQTIEDDEGSGDEESDYTPIKRLHLKEHEVSLKQKNDHVIPAQIKKNKKGKRKMKLWKGMDRTEEINVAEGRRVFESRRRINMANKQINPQHWANILAKVRGKNLSRTTAATDPSLRTTSETPFTHQTSRVPPPPIASPPLNTAEEVSEDESSADMSHLSEVELFSVTFPPIINAHDNHQEETHYPAMSTIYSVQHEPSSTGQSLYRMESSITKDQQISQNGQTQIWDNSEMKTDQEKSEKLEIIDDFTSNEKIITSLPYSQSPLVTIDSGDTATQYAFSSLDLSSVPSSLTKVHFSESSETYFHQKKINELDNTAISAQSPVNNYVNLKATTPFFTSASPMIEPILKERSKIEHQQIRISSDPFGFSESLILKNANAQKSESTFTVESTTDPFKKKEWRMATIATDKVTTVSMITASERKMTVSEPQVIQHPRRRTYGRKRLRPNRFRRPKLILPTAITVKEIPFIQKIPKIEAVTQNAQHSTFRDYQKPDGETQQANEYEPLEVSSSLTTTITSLQRSTKAQDIEAPSVHQRFASLPKIPATLSNGVKDPKSHLMVTTQDPPTTMAMKEFYLSHHSEQVLMTPTENELIKVLAGDTIRQNNEITKTHRTRTSVPILSFTSSLSPSDLNHSKIPEFAEESLPFGSSENVLNPRVVLSRPPTVQYMTTIKSTEEDLKTPPNADKVHNVSETPPVTTFATSSHQKETMTLAHIMDDHLFTPTEMKETINPWQSTTSILPSSKESITQLHDHHDKTAVYRNEKGYPPVLPVASLPLATTLHPLIQSTLTFSDHSSRNKNYTYSQPAIPDNKGSTADNIKAKLSSRQNELSTFHSSHNRITTQQKQGQLKEPYGSRSYNSLSPNILRQPIGMIPIFSQPPVYVPPKHIPARGTMKTPYLMVPGLFHHFVTQQVPLRYTNKPEITAYAAQTTQDRKNSSYAETFPTTTPAQLYRPKVHTSSRNGNQGESRYTSYSRVFANNYLPEIKDKPGRTINQAVPHFSNSRMPFLINRTRVFQHLGVNSKLAVPNVRAPVSTTEKKFLPPPSTITQSTLLKATAMPEPPISLVTVPPTAVATPTFLTPSTRSQTTSSTSSSRNFHHHHPNVLFVPKLGGVRPLNSSIMQSSTLFRTQGEKPKITKKSNSLSILAESDAIIPCDAVGEPKPFLSWTKISTGALMTANTRIQRFEVLKNGTFIIRNVQLQDRGQYLCTAQNPHGTDKMIVLLTVLAQQPKMLGPRFRDVTVYFGEKVTMDCQANGIPNPHISWIFPDRKILQTVSTTEGRVMLYENRTLSLKDTSFSDRGVYKCIASNAAGADSIAVRLHVAALPPIIQQEKVENISLSVGQNINIHCSAKAAPLPGIRWVLFDGTQIRTSQFVHGNLFVFPNGTLYIRNVSPKDSGSYECIAANMVGAARRTVWLHVKKQSTNAKITGSSPQRTDVTYGSALRLVCSASGDPWPRILWRLPSKRMVDSLHSLDSRIKVFGNGTLVVHSVTDKDAGDYLCVARNKIGDDYVVLKVNVMMKPAKIEHKNENNHKVIYGGDLKVDCVATGLPNPEISWSLPDGSMINTFMQSDDSGSRTKRYVVFNNGTLYFNDVGLREEGDYTCYAENQIGKDEMKVRVKVVAEPAIIRNKTYTVLNIPYGDVVSVGCEAKGEPTPKVIWLSPSNRPIPLLSDKYQVYRDGTLLIQKAQRSDSGNYTCVARNSAGEDRKVVWVHVNVQPPRINGHLSTITSMREMALRDSRKLIDCKAEGIPSPRVMWAFPEGVILPAPYYGNRITVHRNGTLDIRGVRQTDSVQLVCIGRNEGGEARLIVQLQVMDHVEKPTFKDPTMERITAAAGHSINLNCSVQGNPQPSTAWILPNGTELQKGSHLQRFYHKRDGILHISALSAADAGTYRCTAQNSWGYVERVVFLKVGLKPEISNQYNNLVSIINGETLQLHCITQPSQQARITWTLPNGMVLDSPQTLGRFSLSENGSLTVREASVFDRGTYLCKVVTEYGSSLMNVPVIVIAYPPRITSEPTPVIYARPGNTVKLNCMAIGIPKAEITWEIPDKSHLTTGAQSRLYGNKFLHPQGSLIIQQATQRDAGFYKCIAKNILGSDSKATYIHIF